MRVRIGTRGSDLALWQARHVAAALNRAGAETELVVLKTRGDLIDDVPLSGVEGKAFFTAEIERALATGEVDLAVHSHKDLPTESPPGLAIVAVPVRAASGERLLVRPEAHRPEAALLPLVAGARVGTSAPRREQQVRALRPDLVVTPLRGNVPTRVDRLRQGRHDAILLAAAGLDRLALDLSDLVVLDLALDRLTPSPAQGALALQVRADDAELTALCRRVLHHEPTARAIAAERRLLTLAGGGCNLPLGAVVAADVEADEDEAAGSGPWRAHVFLGAGHPGPRQALPRWAEGRGDDPEAAVQRAWAAVVGGGPTGAGPLAGLSVALTGSAAGDTHVGARLESLGARVVHEQVIRFEDLPCEDLRARLAALGPGDALAITSRRAARTLQGQGLSAGVAVCAVGPASARALEQHGLPVDLVGPGGAGELARAMLERGLVRPGARVLFPCAADARRDLERTLGEAGVEVERLPTYRTVPQPDPELDAEVQARVFMSPSSVRAAGAWERAHPSRATRRFAVGATTADELRRAGLEADSTAKALEDLAPLETLVQHLARLAAGGALRA